MHDEVAVSRHKWFTIFRKPLPKGRKTFVFEIRNNDSSHIIGTISWYSTWRQYCFFPEADTVWSAGCLEEVDAFLAVLARRRRERITKGREKEGEPCPDCRDRPGRRRSLRPLGWIKCKRCNGKGKVVAT